MVYGAEPPQVLSRLSASNGNEGDNGLATGCFVSYTSAILAATAECATIKFKSNPSETFATYQTLPSGSEISLGVGKPLFREFFEFQSKRVTDALTACCGIKRGEPLVTDAARAGRVIEAAVEFVMDNASPEDQAKVHGPIDYGILTGGGMRWIRREPNCSTEDVKSKTIPEKAASKP